MIDKEEKKEALLDYLRDKGYADEDLANIEVLDEENSSFSVCDEEYRVLTDEEADDVARIDIENSLWAFNPDFILEHCSAYGKSDEKQLKRMENALSTMLETLCDDANPIVEALIGGVDGIGDFVSDAIDSDGRGHFISLYDGEEHESGDYFIYRI